MANSAAPLMNIFGTTDHLIPLILDDLSDAVARTRARDEEGPSIAWHLGPPLLPARGPSDAESG